MPETPGPDAGQPHLRRRRVKIARRAKARIEVQGFTDTAGTRDQNMSLSQARAEHVADVLVRHGISPKRITARGYGEEQLAVRTGNGVPEPRNRRVVIRLIG